jgi:D-alanyl-D-alanine carboxypeptidase
MEATDLPEVSAKSWALYEMRSERLLFGKRDYKRREMASLTKIMNLSTILDLLARYAIDAKRVNLRATKSACSMIGTTAELK